MRIGLVIYGSLDMLSGGYLYDRKLVEFLRSKGDSVEVVSLPWRSYTSCLVDNLSPAVRKRLDKLDVDVLLEDELNHPSLFLLNGPLLWQGRFPVLSIVHHLRSSERHPPALLPFCRAVERRYLRSVEGFIYNSQTTRVAVDQLRGAPGRGVVAYPAGDRFGSLTREEIHAHRQDNAPLKCLFIGNLIPRKGLHTMLAALRQLPPGSVDLRVAGRDDADPGYTARLRRMAASLGGQVSFLGRRSDDEIRAELCRADVLVVPSSYEGFGIVYLEGMAYGLPAVATTGGGASEIVQDGLNGLLVPPENSDALARALLSLAGDRERLGRMRLAARAHFDEFPTWQQATEAVHQFLLVWE